MFTLALEQSLTSVIKRKKMILDYAFLFFRLVRIVLVILTHCFWMNYRREPFSIVRLVFFTSRNFFGSLGILLFHVELQLQGVLLLCVVLGTSLSNFKMCFQAVSMSSYLFRFFLIILV